MKKRYLIIIFFILMGLHTYGDVDEPEEIDFLLFLPNSGNRFVNENQAMNQLENLAEHLKGRNLIPGKIFVYGYAAAVDNGIEPINLSRDRALFVMEELQKRGVPEDQFSEPVAYGSVDLWGSNSSEENRSPNRRVRILVDGTFITPDTLKVPEPVVPISIIDNEEKPVKQENLAAESRSKFPWIYLIPLFLIALIAAILLLLSKRRKKEVEKTPVPAVPVEPVVPVIPVVAAVPVVPVAAVPADPPPVTVSEPKIDIVPIAAAVIAYDSAVCLEEEIRRRAYELYMERGGFNGNEDGDWYKALPEICGRYEADGYEVYMENGCWWARKRLP